METIYLKSGQKADLIQKLETGEYLVDPYYSYYEYDGGEVSEPSNQRIVVSEIFEKPRIEKISEEYTVLLNRVAVKNKELASINSEIRDSNKELDAIDEKRKEKFSKYEQLNKLENFIDGKITHYAILDYNPRIEEFKPEKREYDDEVTKLLTLFGKSKGDLNWKINCYSDGSGSNSDAIPCLSLEEAIVALKSYINSKDQINEYCVRASEKYDFEIDKTLLDTYNKSKKDRQRKIVKELEDKLSKERLGLRGLK